MTFISRGSQIQPHIVGCSVHKYDILKPSAVPVMSSFPYVLVWKLENHVLLVNVLKPGGVFCLFFVFLTPMSI